MKSRITIPLTLLFALLLLFLSPTIFAQDSLNVSFVSSLSSVWGVADDVAVEGHHAYILAGGLHVVDISDPTSPIEVACLRDIPALHHITTSNNFVYAAGVNGLAIYDASDPTSPVETAHFRPPGTEVVNGLDVVGNWLYLATDPTGLIVVDVSDPSSPVQIGQFGAYSLTFASVDVVGQYAYACGSNGLSVIDISDPTGPFEVGSIETTLGAYNAKVSNGYAYVADSDYWNFEGSMRVIDVSTPSLPTEVGNYDVPTAFQSLAIVDQFVYVANESYGLIILDVSNPGVPVEVGSCDTRSYAHSIAVVNNHAYVACWFIGLVIVDVTDPNAPDEVGYIDGPTNAHGVSLADDYAYIVDVDGLRIVDISNPHSMVEVALFDSVKNFDRVVNDGGYVYGSSVYAGLVIVDASDPATPTLLADSLGCGIPVAVVDNQLYSYDANGFFINDVSDPSEVVELAYTQIEDMRGLAVDDGLACIVTEDRLLVFDLADPANPEELGFCETNGDLDKVELENGFALTANHDGGIVVFDVTDPSNPVEAGRYDATWFPWDIAMQGSFGFVVDTSKHLRVFNITDAVTPEEIGYYDLSNLNSMPKGIAVNGDYVYVADHYYFNVYDCSAATPVAETGGQARPVTYSLVSVYPNPFNPTATLSISLPATAALTVTVHNVLGQQIAEVADGRYTGGRHTFTLDGSTWASGVYFVRACVPGQLNATQKVVLMK